MTKPSHPDAIDQSWGYADPKAAYAAGIRVVSMYLSHDPSKNITPSKVKAYHAAGIAVLLNWEAQAGAPLNGPQQGQADAAEAVRQAQVLIASVGYKPANELAIIFSCDRDTSSADYPKIDGYYIATRTVTHAAGYLNGVYGEANLIEHLHAKGITDVEWQSYAWSGGRLSPEADLYQFLNGQKLAGASVDFDKVEHAAQLGAWWPPNHPNNIGEDMPLTDTDLAKIGAKVVDAIQGANWLTWQDGMKDGYKFDTVVRKALDDKLAAIAAVDNAVKAAIAQLQLTGVDPDALAKAIVAHMDINVAAK